MKNINKIFALILAALMIVGMVSAFADDPAYDHPLTVTGLENGDVAHFYKVIEWVDNATGNVKGWKAVEPFDTILDTAKLTEILVGTPDDPATTDVNEYVAPAGISAALAGQLAKLAKDLTGTDVTAASGTATLNNDAPGMWMALITPSDPDYVYNPIFVSADYNKKDAGTAAATTSLSYSDTAAAKKSKTELTKTATVTEEDYADGSWTTTAIGEEVTFTVKTTIPAYKDVYTHPFFKLTDKLTDLKLSGNITVSPADGATATPAADGKSYTVEWSEDYLKTVAVPTEVTITYKAIVTTTAPVHVNTENNEVSTEFSHNPSDESDHGFKKDETNHYTFTLDADGLGSTSTQTGRRTSEIVKVGVDENGNRIMSEPTVSEIVDDRVETVAGPLAGAIFKLYTDAACEHEYTPKKPDGTAGTPLQLESGPDGRFTIKGLDAGTYYLREEQAPAGFVKDGNAHKIEIIAVTSTETVTEYTTDGETWISAEAYAALTDKTGYKSYEYDVDVLESYTVKIDGVVAANYHFTNKGPDAEIVWTEDEPIEVPSTIVNTKGTELPSTGGVGTTIFYVVGSLLVLAAAVLLVAKRRMNER